ncbi:MAG: type 3 dihydrofolate reductase [Thermoflexibacter sp.]
MIISAIVAKSLNNVIGKNNQLPWHLPADLKHFKVLTLNHHILMGRKTFASIGKPLPQRVCIVLSRGADALREQVENLVWVSALEMGIAYAKEQGEKELFIIGGAEIYRLAMPLLHRLYVTEVHTYLEGDAFFPEIDKKIWIEKSRKSHLRDEKNFFDYDFVIYEKLS